MRKVLLLLFVVSFCIKLFAQTPFVTNNLLIVRAGDGAVPVSGTVPVFIDEYSPEGAFVRTINMPATASGANKRFTLTSLTSTEGLATLSADFKYVTLVGYDASPGTTGAGQATASTVNRVIAFINQAGVISTSLVLDNNYTLAPRSAVTDDGTNVWIAGSSGGIKYVPTNTSNPAVVTVASAFSPRSVNIFNGQLYTTLSNTAPATRMGSIGAGLPTTTDQSLTGLPGIPEGTGSPNGFVFFDTDNNSAPDLLYIADDGAGLSKYHFDGTSWIAKGTAAVSGFANNQLRGITGRYTQGKGYILYGSTQSSILKFVDNTLPAQTIGAVPSEIITAATNTSFKGLSFTPGTNVLPIDLGAFKGSSNGSAVVLKWSTLSEQNNSHFDVERSADGEKFDRIARIAGQGTTSTNTNYTFEDSNSRAGVNYYRLKQVDFNGDFSYSWVIPVHSILNNNAFNIWVDVNGALNLDIESKNEAYVQVRIADVSGREITQERIHLQAGRNKQVINLAGNPPGVYLAICKEIKLVKKFYKP